MRKISFDTIRKETVALCLSAAFDLPEDVESAIRKALNEESSPRGKAFLAQYLENAELARKERLPICQDTGVTVFFVELGQSVEVDGGLLTNAISSGVEEAYKAGYLRMSIVSDPLFDRKNTKTNTPPVIHVKLVPGNTIKIILAPKGGGSENMSALAMLKPSQGRKGVVDFVVDTVVKAGGNPCPPTIVGVGIGGNFEMSALLAKKALLRKLGTTNPDPRYAELEAEILQKINLSGVGPQGLGGSVTSFAVHIETMPCHLASLPVAVNLNCHAARHKESTI